MGIRGIYTCVCLECEELVFPKQSWLAVWPRDLTELQVQPRTNRMASLDFLSCSAPAGMTLQLLHMLGTCAISGSLQAASYPRGTVTSPCYFAQT